MTRLPLLLLVPLAACSTATKAEPAPSVTVPVSASPSVVVSLATVPSPVAMSGGAVPVCLVTDVAVHVTPRDQLVGTQPGAEHEGTIVLTSTATHPCSTSGTPGMVLLGDDGQPVEEKVDAVRTAQHGVQPAAVLLQPGGQMSFAFRRSDGTGGDGFTCTHVSDALVSLPGSTATARSGASFTGCDTGHGLPLTVGPLLAGATAALGG